MFFCSEWWKASNETWKQNISSPGVSMKFFFSPLIAQWNWRIITFSVNVKLMAFLNKKLAANIMSSYSAPKGGFGHFAAHLWNIRLPCRAKYSIKKEHSEDRGGCGNFFVLVVEFCISTNCHMNLTSQSCFKVTRQSFCKPPTPNLFTHDVKNICI